MQKYKFYLLNVLFYKFIVFFYVCSACLSSGLAQSLGCSNAEECLIKRLLDNNAYDNRARPLPSFGEDVPIQVTVRMDLFRLVDVDMKQEKISLHVFMHQKWLDPRLAWDPRDFSNITSITIDHGSLWLPDTTVINAATTNDEQRTAKGLARIQTLYDTVARRWSNADVSLIYPAIFEPVCAMDMRYFPFDKQTCVLTMGSNAQDASKIEFHLAANHMTLEEFHDTGEWTVDDLRMDQNYVFYNCCRLPFSQINARVVLKRKPLFYIANLILPTLLTNILATVGLFSNLNVVGGELTAVTLGLTTLLAFSILLLSVSEQMPKGSHWLSLIGCFFVGIIVQTCVATITAVYLMRVERREKFKRLFCYSSLYGKKRGTFKPNTADLSVLGHTDAPKKNVSNTFRYRLRNSSESDSEQLEGSPVDSCLEHWCMCFHVVFTMTFTVVVLTIGAFNANIL